jgi:hypothetical protein
MIKYFTSLLFVFFATNGFTQSQWELQKDENNIKVWTKDVEGSSFKEFKAETTLKTSLENIVSVFLDIPNMSKWYDRVEKVTLHEKITDLEAIYIIDFALPWPVKDRISSVRAKLTYEPGQQKVFVHTAYEPNVIKETDKVLVTKMYSEWILTEQENKTVHIFHKGFMDPEGSLPAWIANAGVKDGPIQSITNLEKILPEYRNQQVPFME